MTPELRAAVADTAATFKRCLALARLYHPGHDAVRELSTQAAAKLKAALSLSSSSPITLTVEARSLSFGGKPVLTDDGTETAASTLFVDGVAALTFDGAVSDDAVVELVRLWARAGDRRQPLPPDQTFSTLVWESALKGITVVPQHDDVAADPTQQPEAQQALLKKQALTAKLLQTTPLPLPPTSTTEALPAFSTENTLAALLSGTLSALSSSSPALSAEEREQLLALCARAVAGALKDAGPAVVGAAYEGAVAVARGLAVARPGIGADLEALCTLFARDEVRAALSVAADAVDGAELMKALRFLPRKQLHVLLGLAGAPQAKEAVARRLAELTIRDDEWPALVAAADAGGIDVVFAAARGKGERAAVAVVDAARGLPAHERDVFVELLKQLRGAEVEAARPLLHQAMTRPGSAAVAEDMLVRLKDPAVLPRVVARLHDEARPVEQRRLAALALTRFDGDDGKAALRAAFASVRNDEVKGAIASALATAKDTSARPLLEAVAKKLIVDRGLKRACEEAVKRLDGAAP